MTTFASVTLENEMDMILAYKKAIHIAELLGLSVSTQTAFATAVSEVCREIIDKSTDGVAALGAETEDSRYSLCARISFSSFEKFNAGNPGYEYARKLIPVVETTANENNIETLLKLGIPRSIRLDKRRIIDITKKIEQEGPISAYEEVKLRNADLQQISQQKDIDLAESNYLNQQKNEFLSVASHELNSPLTILRSYSQIALKMEGGQNPVLHNYLKKIELQSGKMAQLIRQLLDISKIENGKVVYDKQVVDFGTFVDSTAETLAQLVPMHQVRVEAGHSGNLFIDKMRIEQVLNNLVSNAAKYSEPGTDILVKTTLADGRIKTSVQDSGIGMSPETIKNIFGKFYRDQNVLRKYSGLGMGLYITSRIIEDHQGTMEVSSIEGNGSILSFSLPLSTH